MPPTLNSSLIGDLGAHYINTKEVSVTEASAKYGPFDLILEGTGYSPLVFEAMNILAKNGVLAMVSVTGGSRQIEIPADKINLGFVLGNKVAFGSVNANFIRPFTSFHPPVVSAERVAGRTVTLGGNFDYPLCMPHGEVGA